MCAIIIIRVSIFFRIVRKPRSALFWTSFACLFRRSRCLSVTCNVSDRFPINLFTCVQAQLFLLVPTKNVVLKTMKKLLGINCKTRTSSLRPYFSRRMSINVL